jgi:prepilin-type N-terminal cleavage/methylation domain-containing protein
MKKHGFTLAEVLITLGIIGVVSALVIPTFTAQTQNAKIGPRVGKAISSFEQATKALIEEAGADTLSGSTVDNLALSNAAGTAAEVSNFVNALGTHLKGGTTTALSGYTATYASADGFTYNFGTAGTIGTNSHPHRNNYINTVMVDVNGPAEPNSDARDRFYFSVADDGSLVAWGSAGIALSGTANPGARTKKWSDAGVCQADHKPGTTGSPAGAMFCAGHVVENGMKALYK